MRGRLPEELWAFVSKGASRGALEICFDVGMKAGQNHQAKYGLFYAGWPNGAPPAVAGSVHRLADAHGGMYSRVGGALSHAC